MGEQPPRVPGTGQWPSRRRGFAFCAVGVGYGAATVAAGWFLASGWVAWAVAISGVGAGAMLLSLGCYIVSTAPPTP